MVVLVRDGCHLCDEVLRLANRVCAEAGVALAALNVDSDAALRSAYTDHVPVTFVDGRRIAIWGLEAEQLSEALGRRA